MGREGEEEGGGCGKVVLMIRAGRRRKAQG